VSNAPKVNSNDIAMIRYLLLIVCLASNALSEDQVDSSREGKLAVLSVDTFRTFNRKTTLIQLFDKVGMPKSITGSGITMMHYPLDHQREVVVGSLGMTPDENMDLRRFEWVALSILLCS
jgi:hypothetical protein